MEALTCYIYIYIYVPLYSAVPSCDRLLLTDHAGGVLAALLGQAGKSSM